MNSYRLTSLTAGLLLAAGSLVHAQQRQKPAGAAPVAHAAAARRVWADPQEDERDGGALSPDGRLYAFSTGLRSDLMIRTLATGDMRYLTGSRAPRKTINGSAYAPRFSRDGKLIAYAWDDDSLPGYQVYVIDAAGSTARMVYRPVVDGDPLPQDWTPDGRYILATEATPDRTVRLMLLPTAGGTPRILKSFLDWQRPSRARISPDGKLVAYENRPRKDVIGRDIFVLALDGSRESAVVTGPSDDQLVGWTPDGRLAYISDRTGRPALWTVRLAADYAPSAPALIKNDMWRTADFDLTPTGTFFYSVQSGDRDIFGAAFDPIAGKLLSKPVSITGHPGEAHLFPEISRDGRLISYVTGSTDLRRQRYARAGGTTITVQSLEGGQSRTLRPPLAGISDVAWGSDDKSLIMVARDDKGQPTPQRLNLETGEATVTDYPFIPPRFSRDGAWMYSLAPNRERPSTAMWRVTARRLSDGVEHTVWQSALPGWTPSTRRPPLLSPDGRSIVFGLRSFGDSAYSARIQVVDVESGAMRELLSTSTFPGNLLQPAALTPDGKYVLMETTEMTGNPNRHPSKLWRVPMGGGAPQQVEVPWAEFDTPVLSADGRRILFAAGTVEPEYWVLEDARLGFAGASSRGAKRDQR